MPSGSYSRRDSFGNTSHHSYTSSSRPVYASYRQEFSTSYGSYTPSYGTTDPFQYQVDDYAGQRSSRRRAGPDPFDYLDGGSGSHGSGRHHRSSRTTADPVHYDYDDVGRDRHRDRHRDHHSDRHHGGTRERSTRSAATPYDYIEVESPGGTRERTRTTRSTVDPFDYIEVVSPRSSRHERTRARANVFDFEVEEFDDRQPARSASSATGNSFDHLPKKKVTRADFDSNGKAECSICQDDLRLGDEVTVLPCVHFFHGSCVTRWLEQQQRPTCPLCRTAVEGGSAGGHGEANRRSEAPRSSGRQSGRRGSLYEELLQHETNRSYRERPRADRHSSSRSGRSRRDDRYYAHSDSGYGSGDVDDDGWQRLPPDMDDRAYYDY